MVLFAAMMIMITMVFPFLFRKSTLPALTLPLSDRPQDSNRSHYSLQLQPRS